MRYLGGEYSDERAGSMVSTRLAVLLFCAMFTTLDGFAQSQDGTMASPVTLPNGNTPPGEIRNTGHHGNDFLWTMFTPGGRMVSESLRDGSRRIVFKWWRSVAGSLTVTRLDAPAPSIHGRIDSFRGAAFEASAINFPTSGCWEIAARIGNNSLRFVVELVE
jgi:hypothetical protein